MTFRHRAFATVLASLFAGVLSACKPTTWTAPANPDMTKIWSMRPSIGMPSEMRSHC
jgi:hypothetical protein